MLTAHELYDFFVNRSDVFAEQLPDGSYKVHRRDLTITDIDKHLNGEWTLGVYQLDTDNQCKWLCWDIDSNNASDLYKLVGNVKGPYWVESSGSKGWHVFQFLTQPTPASAVRVYVQDVLTQSSLDLEAFPKQGNLTGKGLGSLVKLPLGLHQVSKARSKFLFGDLKKVDFVGLVSVNFNSPISSVTSTPSNGNMTNGVESTWIEEIFSGVQQGNRNDKLNKLSYWLYSRGFPEDAVRAVLDVANSTFNPPLDDNELRIVGRPR